MKAFSIFSVIFTMFAFSAQAQTMLVQPTGGRIQTGMFQPLPTYSAVDAIAQRGVIRCGTNLKNPAYARMEDNVWKGIDVDLCRIMAQAINGDRNKFEMVHVGSDNAVDALNSGKIDVMLSGATYSAQMETSRQVLGVGPLYFDSQQIMTRGGEPEDLTNYKDKKICIPADSGSQRNFEEYNAKHNFGITYLTFKDQNQASEAFMLKRCSLITANGLVLQGLKKSMPKLEVNLLPMKIASQPMYAMVRYDNLDLQLALKWVFNAMFLAEQYDIKGTNLGFYATNDQPELRNLFGDNPQMWRGLHIQPNWLREVIGSIGNYAEIYERNIGMESEYLQPRGAGKLMRDGGTILPLPFM